MRAGSFAYDNLLDYSPTSVLVMQQSKGVHIPKINPPSETRAPIMNTLKLKSLKGSSLSSSPFTCDGSVASLDGLSVFSLDSLARLSLRDSFDSMPAMTGWRVRRRVCRDVLAASRAAMKLRKEYREGCS